MAYKLTLIKLLKTLFFELFAKDFLSVVDEQIMEHPHLQGLRRWILLTDTAEWLYRKFGFTKIPKPEVYMEKHNPNVYNS